MKKIIAIILIVISTIISIGCDKSEFIDDQENYENIYTKMTKEDEEFLKKCGLEERQMKFIKKRGLDVGQKKFIRVAKDILNYLEKKYSESFDVVYAYVPSAESDNYAITAEAKSGIYAFKDFRAYYNEGKGYSDEYFNICMADRAGQAATNILSNEYDNVKVIARLNYYYTEDYDINMSDEELLQKCDFTFFVLYYGPDTKENDFKKITKNIEKRLNDNKIHFDGYTYCFKIDLSYVNNCDQFCYVNKTLGRENVYLYEENIVQL